MRYIQATIFFCIPQGSWEIVEVLKLFLQPSDVHGGNGVGVEVPTFPLLELMSLSLSLATLDLVRRLVVLSGNCICPPSGAHWLPPSFAVIMFNRHKLPFRAPIVPKKVL